MKTDKTNHEVLQEFLDIVLQTCNEAMIKAEKIGLAERMDKSVLSGLIAGIVGQSVQTTSKGESNVIS